MKDNSGQIPEGLDSLLPKNGSTPEKEALQERISAAVFSNQENSRVHNSYEQELREMHSIETGDLALLRQSWQEYQPHSYGTLSGDLLRNAKDSCIILTAFASRAAIRGGMPPEPAFTIVDYYVQAIEDCKTVVDAVQLAHTAEQEFTSLVARRNGQSSSSGAGSPHVEKCKNYIFAHLHEKLTVQSIGNALGLHPTYLSELFRKQEGISILQYILREKVNLAKNLLIYSNYSYSEIANYLGFSSQSHLGVQFRKQTGTTMAAFRRKYKTAQFQEGDKEL